MTLDHAVSIAERYLGPIVAWCFSATNWAFSGMNPVTAAGAIAALWWTVERALHERSRRRLAEIQAAEYEGYVEQHRGALSRLVDRMRTKPGELR